MHLGSFGDSFFYGCDLEDCDDNLYASNSTWPALIAQQLQLEYTCYADPGSGNRAIFNSIANAIKQHSNRMIYAVNWSWIDRFDYVDPEDNSWWTCRPSGSIYTQPERQTAYYKYLHSELLDKNMSIQLIYSAIKLLQDHDCKFCMTFMDPLILDQRWHCPSEVELLQELSRPYLHTFESGMTFLEWSRHNGYPESDNWHPLEIAHSAAADYWLSYYEQLLLPSPV